MRKKILIIGAVPHLNNLRTFGGTTTLMQNFLDYCKIEHHSVYHIDTFRFRNKIFNLGYFAWKFLCGIFQCKIIMYNVSLNGAFSLFYYTAPLAVAFHKKIVFRKFGGAFFSQLDMCPPSKRKKMLELLSKTEIIYFETQKLIEQAKIVLPFSEKVKWFPNCRKPSHMQKEGTYQKRFVFISHVREEKGVDLLMQVAELLPQDYMIDIYGSIQDKKYAQKDFFKGKRVQYKGALTSDKVLSTLVNYDVLVLPTFWKTEGYPGIIIEAMSVGLPILATSWRGIPELVTNEENGLLIPTKDMEALRKAILFFNEENYRQMSEAARLRFETMYNSDIINARVYNDMISQI